MLSLKPLALSACCATPEDSDPVTAVGGDREPGSRQLADCTAGSGPREASGALGDGRS